MNRGRETCEADSGVKVPPGGDTAATALSAFNNNVIK